MLAAVLVIVLNPGNVLLLAFFLWSVQRYACVVSLCANDDVGMVCSILSSRLPCNHIVVFEVVRSFMLLMSINLAESTLYEVDS